MRWLRIGLLSPLLLPMLGRAQYAPVAGWCVNGAKPAITSGLNSSNFNLSVIPRCVVTVVLTGTTTPATLFADTNQTPLANPFTANTDGSWMFFVSTPAGTAQGYDVTLNGPSGVAAPNTYVTPRTLVGLFPLGEPGTPGGGGTITAVIAGAGLSGGGTEGEVTLVNAAPMVYPATGIAVSTGTAWGPALDPAKLITAVIAGAGLSGGGTEGEVTLVNAAPMVYPATGIGVSTGTAWGPSLDPSTLATWPPEGIPVSNGNNSWGVSINPATLATWPPPSAVCAASSATPNCMDYIPVSNITGTGWTGILNASGQITTGPLSSTTPPSSTGFSGPIFIFSWPGTTPDVMQGNVAVGNGYANFGYRSMGDSGIAVSNVARLNSFGGQLFTISTVASTPLNFPNLPFPPGINFLPGSTNDLNTATWCGDFSISNIVSSPSPGWPLNMPPNVLPVNGGIAVPMHVNCTGGPGAITVSSGHAQMVFDPSANIMWLRTAFGGNWNPWRLAASLNNLTVATLPTCNAAAKGSVAGVSDATAPTFLGTLTGGGTVSSPAYCNGTAWVAY